MGVPSQDSRGDGVSMRCTEMGSRGHPAVHDGAFRATVRWADWGIGQVNAYSSLRFSNSGCSMRIPNDGPPWTVSMGTPTGCVRTLARRKDS
jgi:hypothetical protein